MGPVTVLLSIDAQYLFVNLTKKLASMPSQMCYLNGEMQKKKVGFHFSFMGEEIFFVKKQYLPGYLFSLSINTEGPKR